jgi:hypothetical protein
MSVSGLTIEMVHLLRAGTLGLIFGILLAEVVLMLRPFSLDLVPRRLALIALAALLLTSWVAGARIAWDTPSIIVATVMGFGVAATLWVLAHRGHNDISLAESGLLSDQELGRQKEDSDHWVLVTGAIASGKSTLINQMVEAAVSSDTFNDLQLDGGKRSAESGSATAVELRLISPKDGPVRLRIWESEHLTSSSNQLPALHDFDAIVAVVDPTRLSGITNTFPDGVKLRNEPVDANSMVLDIVDALGHDRSSPTVWLVITKADLIRFSVAPGLLKFPIQAGPAWREQLALLNIVGRWRLAEELNLEQLNRSHEPAFKWGAGSPLLTFNGGHPGRTGEPFGGPELMKLIVDALNLATKRNSSI